MKIFKTLCCIVALTVNPLTAKEHHSFSGEQILADIDLLQDVFKTYHPGLYRYQDEEAFDARINALRTELQNGASLSETYLGITKLAASIRCGHTHTNPYNQPRPVKVSTLWGMDKLPVTIDKVEGRYWISANASDNEDLARGDELIAINGEPMPTLMARMSTYIAADGSNDRKRYQRLELNGYNKPQWFDILLPMLQPPVDGEYELTLQSRESDQTQTVRVAAIKAKKRHERVASAYPEFALPSELRWQYKMLAPKVAYLRFHTFATFNMDLDWKAFIDKAFAQFRLQQADKLIIDIRGNGGGMYEVVEYLYGYIAKAPFQVEKPREDVVYNKVAERHRPHLGTWNPDIYDVRQFVGDREKPVYTLNPARTVEIAPRQDAFGGDVYLLIDGSNNSATFTMAREVRQAGIAALVGQPNGGNLRGMNGGQMFFVNLPNTGIEVDLPLIGYYAEQDLPDGGMTPDIEVEQTLADWIDGKDSAIEYLLATFNRAP